MTGCRTAMVIGAIAGAGTVAIIVIAKYKANAAQIAAAQQQVHAFYADAAKPASQRKHDHVKDAKKHADAAAAGVANAEAGHVAAGGKPQPAHAAEAANLPQPIPSTDELDTSGARHLPHFLAVPVPPQHIPAEEGGKATYMVWDTHRQQLATDDVYVVNRDVRAGAIVKLDGMKAKVARAE